MYSYKEGNRPTGVLDHNFNFLLKRRSQQLLLMAF